MKIRFLGAHNTESSSSGLMCLLLDEVVALDAGSLTSKLSLKEQLSLKAVLLTHGHYDHIRDLPMLAMNCFLNLGVVHAYRGEALPLADEPDVVLVGGSPLAAYDYHQHRFLVEEAAYLRRAADAGVPCFGICFGAQFLAHLLGGAERRGDQHPEQSHQGCRTHHGLANHSTG